MARLESAGIPGSVADDINGCKKRESAGEQKDEPNLAFGAQGLPEVDAAD